MKKRMIGFCMVLLLGTALLLQGCGKSSAVATEEETTQETAAKVFTYGTTAYGTDMGNVGVNPHENYSGWSAVRYGVGETLFKFDSSMQVQPWLAESYEQIDEYTIKITLRDDVYFSNGRKMDGEAVKECLEDLIQVHDRAPEDLKISEIAADGQTVTITTTQKATSTINYLSDPYGAIIDMQAENEVEGNVAGTGPFIAQSISDQEITLVKNENYWGGEVKIDQVIVKSIQDGDTLTMALQSGEIDAAQGLPYASLSLFQDNEAYTISSAETSRSFFAQLNFKTEALQDANVREAIAMGIDKESFTSVLLQGNGVPATGPFPESFTFGDETVTAAAYDPQEAQKLLAQAGWEDTDGDGYVDKDQETLTLRWLTYPSRQELPLLAESVQDTLKKIGIKVEINNTSNYQDFVDAGDFDVFAGAFVTAPTGDPEYFFTTHCLSESSKNRGSYYNETLETLAVQLRNEFDTQKRSDIAVEMTQTILDDNAFIFASHLKMSFVMKQKVTGFEAHPSDYYEITADLDIAS
ncbi:MAG: ABC transporter substrate-binding protein [Lachnospiraceae bacterium]